MSIQPLKQGELPINPGGRAVIGPEAEQSLPQALREYPAKLQSSWEDRLFFSFERAHRTDDDITKDLEVTYEWEKLKDFVATELALAEQRVREQDLEDVVDFLQNASAQEGTAEMTLVIDQIMKYLEGKN